ncbi:MAG: hypothetical protein OEW37_02845 [Rhodospirillaceae bacterium]|nr:hypothetical protein [Rhodospirillaceae bacterium]
MFDIAKSSAEENLAAAQRKRMRIAEEKETIRQEKAEKVARLRALRLASKAGEKTKKKA